MAQISPFAGLPPEPADLLDVPRLIRAYEAGRPDPSVPAQRVLFGTSGHRGSSFELSFNENHILAISQSICLYRKEHGIDGPLFLGFDTHALSLPAFRTALEVLVANEVNVMVDENLDFTPTPVISHAILRYNEGRAEGLADGIVITPSHNPPREGGFKYNPSHGGPAEKEVTDKIQKKANEILSGGLGGVRRAPFSRAIASAFTHRHDFLHPYIRDLENVVEMDIVRHSKVKIAVDPLGGAGVHYWQPIADLYRIDLSVLNTEIDPCFRFMTRDWDGQIRMDPSSKYAMRSLIAKGGAYDISFACDTDHDRHGIVSRDSGLIPPNHYLSAAAFYLFRHRPLWPAGLKVGKTVVSSRMIDRVAAALGRGLFEVPVGFKWFVDGLLRGDLGFVGEESAGATFLRGNGAVWTTDKDGIAASLLAAEITGRLGKDPAALYRELTESLGSPSYRRVEAAATAEQRERLAHIKASEMHVEALGGEAIEKITTKAPGNGAEIGGVKVDSASGWLAVRPSGTEDVYKIYAESFRGEEGLDLLLQEGQTMIDQMLAEPAAEVFKG